MSIAIMALILGIGSIFSLFGEIEVEVGEWYTRCVTAAGPELERRLTGQLRDASLVIWQRREA